jgi:nucleoside 2-deoxyribosyltransferase
MPQNVTLYNLLISCPGDVKEEVTLIESSVDEFNEYYADTLGITIKTRHWSKSSYAQSGGKPQALLNEQFVDKCDAAVAIFWTKFGSPTDEYGSGTEEEIERMLQSGKQVFMYFSDKPISPSQMNDEGYKKIQAFREKYKDRGIYFTYSSNEEFKKLFFAHLSMFFLSEKKVKEATSERISDLKLVGVDEFGKLSEVASIYPFTLNTDTNLSQYLDTIRSMYQEIAGMDVGKRVAINNTLFGGFTRPLDIDDDEREYIAAVAKQLELDLPEHFVDLGNLGKD